MRRVVLAFGIVFTTASALFAQVHIQEKVSISPVSKNKLQVDVPSGSVYLFYRSTITVTVTDGYDDLYDPITDMDLVLMSPDWATIVPNALNNFGATWTSQEYEAGAVFMFGVIEHHASGYVDTAGVASMDSPAGYPSGYNPSDTVFRGIINGRYSNGAWGGLYLRVAVNIKAKVDHLDVTVTPDTINCLDSAVVKVIAKDSSDVEVAVPDSAPLFIETSDNFLDFSTLVGPDGTRFWWVETTYGDARSGKIRFAADGPYACGRWEIQIDASTGMICPGYGKTSLTIVPRPPDHFEVYSDPDTIEHSESAAIYVQAKDANDQDMDYDGNILVSAAPGGYGELFYWEPSIASSINGVKNKRRAVHISKDMIATAKKVFAVADEALEVPYVLANQGMLVYSADGNVPDSDATITFTVTAVDKPSATGMGSVVIVGAFCQNRGWWAGKKYDNYVKEKDRNGNPIYYTISSKGCALTCMAMAAKAGGASIDPGMLEQYMEGNNGFGGVNVNWDVICKLSGFAKFRPPIKIGKGLQYKRENGKLIIDEDNSIPMDLSTVDQCLSAGDLVVAQVYNPSTGHNHWVFVREKQGDTYKILDPGCYEGRTDLSAYYNCVFEIVVYRRK